MFRIVAVPPLMMVPQIWVKTEQSGLVQVGLLLETQVVAVNVNELRLASYWWPYGRAVIGNKLQVILFHWVFRNLKKLKFKFQNLKF